MFSIIIPTFNNLDYLKLCLKSIKKNSNFDHEVIFHVNEGVDGTLDFLKNNGYKFSYSKKNEGVCVAFNEAVKLATNKYIVLVVHAIVFSVLMYFINKWILRHVFKSVL